MLVNEQFQRRVLVWYSKHHRDFPWRRTRVPYRILVSEIMLQQTQAARVPEKWKDFIERFPTLQALAHAPLRDVITQWDGLGYNNRALRLHQCARNIVENHRGRFPESLHLLMALPGIGRYTAHALVCFAMGRRVPVVDINGRRIFTRVFRRRRDPSALMSERRAWEIAPDLLPHKKYYEWNQALMDLGATICTARAPQCQCCPLVRTCRSAYAIAPRSKQTTVRKREPMCGNVPRRLVRGRIVQLLRTADPATGIRVEMILIHLRRIYSIMSRRSVHQIIHQLIDDGLVVIRRKTRSAIFVSFP